MIVARDGTGNLGVRQVQLLQLRAIANARRDGTGNLGVVQVERLQLRAIANARRDRTRYIGFLCIDDVEQFALGQRLGYASNFATPKIQYLEFGTLVRIGWGGRRLRSIFVRQTGETWAQQCAFVMVLRKTNVRAHLADTGRQGTSQPWVFLAAKIHDVRKVLENFGWDFTHEVTARQV